LDINLSLRHTVATLAYRAAKVLRDTPAGFSAFRAGAGSRSAGEILAHLGDLLDWALSLARGEARWCDSNAQTWSEDTQRFYSALTAFDEYLGSGEELHTAAGRLFQGPLADALTHVGQIALLRGLAGAPVKGENYYVAKIESGCTGPDQNAPVREF
jgi:hypothetical protein